MHCQDASRSSMKKRIATFAGLALLAVGARLMPTRPTQVPMDKSIAVPVEASDTTASTQNLTTNLLGTQLDRNVLRMDPSTPVALDDLRTNSGWFESDLTNAGQKPGYTEAAATLGEPALASVSGSETASASATPSAVPEPSSSAIVFAAIAPLILMKRPTRGDNHREL